MELFFSWKSRLGCNASNCTKENLNLTGDPRLCLTTTEISVVANAITMLIGLVIIAGNGLVLIVLIRYPARKFTPLSWLLFHLGLADLAIGVTVFFWYGLAELLLLPVTLSLKVASYGISIVAVLASLQGLMMIALDRYLHILHSARYSAIFTKPRLVAILISMWIFPAVTQLFIPIFGWNCVEMCDCRVHNIRPDEEYCFDDSCSQMLPPLTKAQLLVASALSTVFLTVTLSLYAIIFCGAHRHASKVQSSSATSRKRSSVPSSPVSTNISNVSLADDDVFRKSYISSLPVNQNQVFFGKGIKTSAEITPKENGASKSQPGSQTCEDAERRRNDEDVVELALSVKQGKATDKVADQVFAGSKVTNPGVTILYKRSNSARVSISLNELKTTTAVNGSQSTRSFPMLSKQGKKFNRPSVARSVRNTLRQPTTTEGRNGRRSSHRRDVKIMRSMFIIMSVFTFTTAPLMVFIIYTYHNNDRRLKEIFNILLQVTALNSFLNPFLYFSRIPAMKKKLKLFVKSMCKQNVCGTKKQMVPTFNDRRQEQHNNSWESGQSEQTVNA